MIVLQKYFVSVVCTKSVKNNPLVAPLIVLIYNFCEEMFGFL